MLYFPILWALFAGIGDPFLGLTLKKPKENQCFWLRTLKNLRKINVFAFPEHLEPLGAAWRSTWNDEGSGRPCGKSLGGPGGPDIYTNSRSTAQAAD